MGDAPDAKAGANAAEACEHGSIGLTCPKCAADIPTPYDEAEVETRGTPFMLASRPPKTEPGSSAADVDGAEPPSGPRGHHESVGERQGRQPGSDGIAARRLYEGDVSGAGNAVCAVHETENGCVCIHVDDGAHALARLSVAEARELAAHLGAAADLAQLRAREALRG